MTYCSCVKQNLLNATFFTQKQIQIKLVVRLMGIGWKKVIITRTINQFALFRMLIFYRISYLSFKLIQLKIPKHCCYLCKNKHFIFQFILLFKFIFISDSATCFCVEWFEICDSRFGSSICLLKTTTVFKIVTYSGFARYSNPIDS